MIQYPPQNEKIYHQRQQYKRKDGKNSAAGQFQFAFFVDVNLFLLNQVVEHEAFTRCAWVKKNRDAPAVFDLINDRQRPPLRLARFVEILIKFAGNPMAAKDSRRGLPAAQKMKDSPPLPKSDHAGNQR